MRKIVVASVAILILCIQSVMTVTAQQDVSTGCMTFMDVTETTFPVNDSGEFFEGEILTFTVMGPGTFTININDVVIIEDLMNGDQVFYPIPMDEFVAFMVTVVDEVDPSVKITCTPAEDDDDDDDEFDGTLCHFPPGNPDAAHTITVGSQNAFDTHIRNHGDTPGACPEDLNARRDFFDLDIVVFIIPNDGVIQVYGGCDDDDCDDGDEINVVQIINFNIIINQVNNVFVFVDDPEEFAFGQISLIGPSQVLYYLHPDPQDDEIGVFQLNLYLDGVLVNDSILIFIDADGDIVRWTDQGYWVRQLDS